MSRVGLRQVVGSQGGARAVVDAVAAVIGEAVAVEDLEGRLLAGAAAAPASGRFAVTNDGTPLGWVSGPAGAQAVATLLDHLVTKEVERKALGSEVLHLYREINLIYSFSEKLAALLDVERVAALTLREARHLIVATDGAVLLLDDDRPADHGRRLRRRAAAPDRIPQRRRHPRRDRRQRHRRDRQRRRRPIRGGSPRARRCAR